MPFLSPLRYPGGKRKLTNFIKLIYHHNDLLDGEYVEPYAGGASVALALLYDEYVKRIHINDLDHGVYMFWDCALNMTDSLCRLISDTPVTIDEWYRQKNIQKDPNASPLKLGFSTFFLNRTNRSGIISGGVIGGKNQSGNWKIDARYNKINLIERIKKVSRYRDRIHLYNMDAADFLTNISPCLPHSAFIYLDPPYFVKGQQLLYTNYYGPRDHKAIAEYIHNIRHHWVISYDNVMEIRALYNAYRNIDYNVHYSAQDRYNGSEIMFFCHGIDIPDVEDLTRISRRVFRSYLSFSTGHFHEGQDCGGR